MLGESLTSEGVGTRLRSPAEAMCSAPEWGRGPFAGLPRAACSAVRASVHAWMENGSKAEKQNISPNEQ